MKKIVRLLCFVIAIPLMSSEVEITEKDYYAIKPEIVTPHTAWANPAVPELSGLKVLIIAPQYAHRHSIELMQRFDCDYTLFLTYRRIALGVAKNAKSHQRIKGLMKYQKQAELSQLLKQHRYDVIVLGTHWNSIPLEQLYLVLKQVSDKGTGLIIGYAQDGNTMNSYYKRLFKATIKPPLAIIDGIPLAQVQGLKEFAANPAKLITASTFGKGRVLRFNFKYNNFTREFMTPPSYGAKRQDYEFHLSLAVRAMLWAAHKSSSVNVIAPAVPAAWDVNQPPKIVQIKIATAQDIPNTSIKAVWRNRDAVALGTFKMKTSLKKGRNVVAATVPSLPAGTYFCDLQVLKDGKTVGWGSVAARVDAKLQIKQITFDKPLYAPGDAVTVTVNLSAKASSGYKTKFIASDLYGRIIYRGSVPLKSGAGSQKLVFTLPRPLCVMHKLEVELEKDGRAVSLSSAEFCREWRRPADAFQFIAWYGPARNTYMNHLIMRRMADTGLDTAYLAHFFSKDKQYEHALPSARAGIAPFPYSTMTRNSKLVNKHIRKPSLADPKTIKSNYAWAQRSVKQLYPLCPAGYSLGDENKFLPSGPKAELDAHPASIAFFQSWLKKKYRNIAMLNKAWHSKLKSFKQVKPIWLKAARKAKTPAPWIDFRRCMEALYSQHYHNQAKAIKQYDPNAVVGHEGWFYMTSYHAFDWWDMLSGLDMFVPYLAGRTGGEFVRSFQRPGFMGSFWFGSYSNGFGGNSAATNKYFPWYCLSRGFNSAWFFNSYGRPRSGGNYGIAADFRLHDSWRTATAECNEIKRGIDKIILNSNRLDDGIAVYYSPASVHAREFYRVPPVHVDAFEGIHRALLKLGLGYRILSPQQIIDNELEKGKFKVLLMPLTMAMTPAECRAVKTFTENGGTVIADFMPGVYDTSGNVHSAQPLHSIFGLKAKSGGYRVRGLQGRKRDFKAKINGHNYSFALPRGTKYSKASVGKLKPLATVRNIPFILRSLSEKHVLLNFTFNLFKDFNDPQLIAILGELLADAGIKAPIKLVVKDNTAGRPIDLSVFQRAKARFAVVIADKEGVKKPDIKTFKLKLKTEKPAHIYNMRTRKYLGKKSEVDFSLISCETALFGFLPYQVGKLDLSARLNARQLTLSGVLLNSVGAPVPNNHVIIIRVFGPDGKERKYYFSELLTLNGRFGTNVSLALNDTNGTWKVIAEDVISGTKSTIKFRVKN